MIVHAPGCHVPLDWDVLAAFSVIYSERCFACEHLFKHSSPLPLAVINSVWWVPVFPSAWGLMAWFPWFTSYGSGPHLEAGCQYWKLLDASGTQLPFSEAVVNLYNYLFFLGGLKMKDGNTPLKRILLLISLWKKMLTAGQWKEATYIKWLKKQRYDNWMLWMLVYLYSSPKQNND